MNDTKTETEKDPVTAYFERLAIEMKPRFDRYMIPEIKDEGMPSAAPFHDAWNHNLCGACRKCGKRHAQLYTLHLMELELL